MFRIYLFLYDHTEAGEISEIASFRFSFVFVVCVFEMVFLPGRVYSAVRRVRKIKQFVFFSCTTNDRTLYNCY